MTSYLISNFNIFHILLTTRTFLAFISLIYVLCVNVPPNFQSVWKKILFPRILCDSTVAYFQLYEREHI